MNVQVVTDPDGRLLWLSPALPGRSHDLTAARTHRIIRICERHGVPILADLAYQGGGPWLTTRIKRRPLRELTLPKRPSTGLWPRHGHQGCGQGLVLGPLGEGEFTARRAALG